VCTGTIATLTRHLNMSPHHIRKHTLKPSEEQLYSLQLLISTENAPDPKLMYGMYELFVGKPAPTSALRSCAYNYFIYPVRARILTLPRFGVYLLISLAFDTRGIPLACTTDYPICH
jgi:hypothetical protein